MMCFGPSDSKETTLRSLWTMSEKWLKEV